MNHIYRLCLNRSTGQQVAVPESAKNKRGGASGKTALHRVFALTTLAFGIALAFNAQAAGLPTGGEVVSGSAQIQQGANGTVITQGSQTAALNWQSFDIGVGKTVRFDQPSASAIAVNRVVGNTASDIQGSLKANGQVWLINPNGVLFGKDAQVNVGGLVASTLDTADAAGSDKVKFSGSSAATVVNKGKITAADGGYVALLGRDAINQGVITARLGTVALGAGSAMTLTFNDSHLLHVEVTASQLKSLAENRELIVADGGQVFMSAGARDSLIASAVNNTGVVQAQTVEQHDGKIVLLGGMEAGTTTASGKLDASAPQGGNGGFIETSAAKVKVADDANITTQASGGKSGTWLIDPTDFTVSAGSATQTTSGIGAATLSSNLQNGSVAIQTSSSGSQAGDINVNADVSWTSASALSLTAQNNVNLNANINAANGSLVTSSKGFVAAAGATMNTAWTVKSSSTNKADVQLGSNQANYIQYNAGSGINSAATGNGVQFANITPTLNVTGVTGTVEKTYDGTTTANLAGSNLTTTGLQSGDTIQSATGTYSQKDAGANLTVAASNQASNYTIKDGSATVYGYQVSGTPSAQVGIIDPKQLSVEIVGDPTKTYNATTHVVTDSSNFQVDGLVAGEAGAITALHAKQIDYADANAGTNKSISATFERTDFQIAADVAGGFKASNYILPTSTTTGTGTINAAPIYLTGLTAENKTYDGTTTATIDKGTVTMFGVLAGQTGDVTLNTANLNGITGTFADKNAGSDKTVTLANVNNLLTFSGAQAGYQNYVIKTDLGLTANIDKRALGVAGLVADKVYDGTTTVTSFNGGAGTSLTNAIAGDNVFLNAAGVTGAYAQKDVGNGIAVTASGFALSGADAGNYSLGSVALTGDITPKALTIALQNVEKTYDGTNFASLGANNFAVSGFVAGESGQVVQSNDGRYDTKNAGTGKTVTANIEGTDFQLGAGTQLSNYTFSQTVTTNTGKIDPLQLTGVITNNPTKTYDGTTNASLANSNVGLTGFVSGEGASATFSGNKTGTYADPNVGVWGVTANGTAFSGSDFTANAGTSLSNYILPTAYAGYGTITPATLTCNGQCISVNFGGHPVRYYDGTTGVTLDKNDFTVNLSGFVNGEGAAVNQNITGNFVDKNAGNNIPLSAVVTKSDLSGTGTTNLANYVFNFGSSAPGANSGGSTAAADGSYTTVFGTGNILPRVLDVSIIGNPTKTYNGNADAVVTSANIAINSATNAGQAGDNGSGLIAGEGFTVTPTATVQYDSVDATNFNGAGTGAQNVTLQLAAGNFAGTGGASLGNYVIPATATGAGTINKADLYVTGVTANNKVYDTTTAATLNQGNQGLQGLISSDVSNVGINGSGATGQFASPNVARDASGAVIAQGVTVNGYALDSASGNKDKNYVLHQPTDVTATITPVQVQLNGPIANDKTYDGTTTATLTLGNGTLDPYNGSHGIYAQDAADVGFNITNPTGTFATKNAGQNIKVTTDNFFLTGTANGDQSGNYELIQPNLQATINPKQLTVAITSDVTKTYDGSSSATILPGDFALGGVVAGDGIAITQTSSANYGSATAPQQNHDGGAALGLYANLALSDYSPSAGTSLANYILPTSASDQKDGSGNTVLGHINQANLNLDATRVYDGTTAAPSNLYVNGSTNNIATGINGETLSLADNLSGTIANKNVGNDLAVSGLANQVGNGSGLADNYNVGFSLNVTPRPITADFIAQNKDYDGTTTATLAAPATLQANTGSGSGLITGDAVTLNNDTVANFASPNAGTWTVTGNMGITGNDAGNYVFTNGTSTATISPKTVVVTTVNVTGTREYDGTTNAAGSDLSNYGTAGYVQTGVGTETLQLGGTGQVASANVLWGGNTAPTAQNVLDPSVYTFSNGTGIASNYNISVGSAALTITPKDFNLSGTRVYDGTTQANAIDMTGVSSGQYATGVGSESLNFAGLAGVTSSKNVGSYTGIGHGTLDSFTGQNGGIASNYKLVNVNYNITPRPITADFTADNKQYDGTTTAMLTGPATLQANTGSGAGLIANDAVTLNNSTVANFDTKHVGTGKTVTGNMAISGADAGNYTFTNGTTTADITPAPAITVTINDASKVYGQNQISNLNFGGNPQYNVTGLQSGDQVTGVALTSAEATNGSTAVNGGTPYVGSIQSNTSGLTLNNGFSLGDYAGVSFNYGNLTVTPAPLTVTANNQTKTYGDSLAIPNTAFTSAGLQNGETIGSATLTSTGNLAGNPLTNAGSYAGNIVASGAAGGTFNIDNYTVNYVDGGLTVNKKAATVTADSNTLTYNGATQSVNGFTVSGLVNGQDGSVLTGMAESGGSGRNAGGYTHQYATGSYSGNYALTFVPGQLTITPAPITISTTDVTKTYDGLTSAVGTPTVVGGQLFGGDTLNNNGVYAYTDPNAGTGDKTVTVGGVTVNDGNGSGNYKISYADNTTSTINPAALTVTANDASKTYDGQPYSGGNGVTYAGFVHGENQSVLGGALGYTGSGQGAVDAGGYVITPEGYTSGNYTISYVNGALTVNRAVIDLSGARPYAPGDTTAGASGFTNGSGLVTGVNGEQLALTGSGATTSPNAGTYTTGGGTLALGGLALGDNGGAKASNYQLGTGTFTINPLAVGLVDLHGERAYDGTNIATAGTFLNNGYVYIASTGQYLSVTGQGTVASANVQRDANGNPATQNVTLGSLALANGTGSSNAGLASNYTLSTADLRITPAALTVTANDQTRQYDGTAYSGGNGVIYAGFVNGENPSVLGGALGYGGSSQGARNVKAGGYAITPEGYISGNYAIGYVNGKLTITPAPITITTDPVTKTYDGTGSANGNPVVAGGTLFGGDSLSGGVYAYTDPNAGTGKTVTVGGVTLADGNGGGNYVVSYAPNQNSTIDPRVLDLVAQRLYDGTTNAPGSLYGNGGVIATGVGGQTLLLTGVGYTADPSIAAGKLVSYGTLVLNDGNQGGQAGNYKLGTVRLTIVGGRPENFGISDGLLAVLNGALDRTRIPTPYGLTGTHAGNDKKRHLRVERNVERSDFISDLALRVVDGGVKLPISE